MLCQVWDHLHQSKVSRPTFSGFDCNSLFIRFASFRTLSAKRNCSSLRKLRLIGNGRDTTASRARFHFPFLRLPFNICDIVFALFRHFMALRRHEVSSLESFSELFYTIYAATCLDFADRSFATPQALAGRLYSSFHDYLAARTASQN